MRGLSIALLFFLTSIAAFAQSRTILRATAEIRTEDDDRIVTEKVLPNEKKLLLVGQKNIRVCDLVTGKLLASRPIDATPDVTEDKPRVISPNGRYMFVFGNYAARDKKNKLKYPPSLWNLETGKQIAVFDKTTKRVRYAAWSKNGRTLVTASDAIEPERFEADPIEVSFWDGESFQYLNTVPADNIKWTYLSADGSKFFYSVSRVKTVIIDKYLSASGGPISVWDIQTGKVQQTVFANANDETQGMRSILMSPDERLLTYVTQPPNSKDIERTLVALNLDRTSSNYVITRKYEFKPTPKISDWSVSFSPDGKYLALVTGHEAFWSVARGLVVQLYSAETGLKTAELPDHYAPNYWLNDDQILLFDYTQRMEALEVATGRKLYESKLIYKDFRNTRTHEHPRHTEYISFVLLDSTKIVPHLSGRMFVTYSNQYVKVYDAQTGAVLQTVVEPPVDTSKPLDPKKGPRLSHASLVSRAAWSSDGNTLYIVSADKKSVSFWSMN